MGVIVKQHLQPVLRQAGNGVAFVPVLVLAVIIANWAADRDWSLMAQVLVAYVLGLAVFCAVRFCQAFLSPGEVDIGQQLQILYQQIRSGIALIFSVALIAIVADWAAGNDWSLIVTVLVVYALGLVILAANFCLFKRLINIEQLAWLEDMEAGGKQLLASLFTLAQVGAAFVPSVFLTTIVADWAVDQAWSLIPTVLVVSAIGAAVAFVNFSFFDAFMLTKRDQSET